ncbi:hypothetical protein OQA88_12731 [Cercophora sp. LCS_1]
MTTKHDVSTEFFTYSPLNRPSDLRLLKLHTRENGRDDAVTGSLLVSPTTVVGPDNKLESDIPYQALSYTWGDVSARVPITLNGKRFLVTENLFAALRQLHQSDEPLVLWIDAICINQDDAAEKAHQVARMNAIYEGSLRVIAWLGPAADDSDLAIRKLQRMGRLWEIRTTSEIWPAILRQARYEMVGDGPFDPDLPHLLAIKRLLHRPWWERAWIIQEATSSAETFFLCGNVLLERTVLHGAIVIITEIAIENPRYRLVAESLSSAASAILNLTLVKGQIQDALAVVSMAREFKATDPRDKIYALISMLRNRDLLSRLIPMYSVCTRETYVDFARHLVNESPFGLQLDVVGHCGRNLRSSAWDDLRLPSWTPDWRGETGHTPFRKLLGPMDDQGTWFQLTGSIRAYGAGLPPDGGTTHPRFCPPRCNGDLLTVQGCCVDTILAVSGTTRRDASNRYDLIRNPSWQVEDGESEYTPSPSQGPKRPITREEARLHVLVADIAYNDTELPKGRGSQAKDSTEWERSLPACYACEGRQLIQTAGRRIGLGPARARPGDKIYLVYGGQVLYILRPAGGWHTLVGECYLHGLMDGEGFALVDRGEDSPQWETIEIS